MVRIMGGDQSKPINATIELKIEAGEDKVRIEAGEVRYMRTRKGLTNQGTGKDQITRNVRGSNNPRDGKDARYGSLKVTRYGNSSQQLFTQGYGRMHKANTGQRLGGQLGSLYMAQGSETQGAGRPMRRRQSAGISNVKNKAVEIITLTDTEDEEEMNELEARLLKMVEKRNGRKRSQLETRGKYSSL